MSTPSSGSVYSIVVGFDDSPLAERAFLEALKIAERTPRAEIHVVTVSQTVVDGLGVPGFASATSEETARKNLEVRIGATLAQGASR